MKDHKRLIFANKMDSLEEMDKFLEWYNLPRLDQEEKMKLNQYFLKIPANKSSEPNGFTGEFYQTFSKELTPTLFKLLQNIAKEGMLTKPFDETKVTPTTKPDK